MDTFYSWNRVLLRFDMVCPGMVCAEEWSSSRAKCLIRSLSSSERIGQWLGKMRNGEPWGGSFWHGSIYNGNVNLMCSTRWNSGLVIYLSHSTSLPQSLLYFQCTWAECSNELFWLPVVHCLSIWLSWCMSIYKPLTIFKYFFKNHWFNVSIKVGFKGFIRVKAYIFLQGEILVK